MNYVIFGGSRGIGRAISEKLLHGGHSVWVVSRNAGDFSGAIHLEWDALKAVSGELGDEIVGLPDVIHGVVYAPGSITLKPFKGLKMADFQHDLNVNFLGAVKALQSCLAGMKRAETASVVLFSTVAVATGMPFHASIAAAKGAVEGMVRSLAAEWAPQIRVNAIAPSLVHTDLSERLLSSPEKIEAAGKRHPLQRVGNAFDIANCACFLLDAENSWISGEVISVDGGMGKLKI